MAESALIIRIVAENLASAALGELEGEVQGLSGHLQSFGEQAIATGAMLTAGITLPIAGAAIEAVKSAAEYETAMQKIVALVGVSQDQVDAWGADIEKLSAETGKGTVELADAMFFITSAGLRGQDAMDALTASAEASVAGLGSMKVVADAATSAMNAYGPANLSAAQATSVLIAAVREGKMPAEDLASSIGRVIPVAAEMHVGFDQVAAAVAGLTREGLTADEATTALRQILVEMLKPAAQTTTAMADLGLSMADVRKVAAEQGLFPALMMIKQAIGDNDDVIGKVIPNVRALAGFLSLTGENAEANAAIFEDLAKVTGEDLQTAFDTMADTAEHKFSVAMNDVKLLFEDIGLTLLPMVIPLFQGLSTILVSAKDAWDGMNPAIKDAIIGFLGAEAAIGPLMVVIGSLSMVLAALLSPLGAVMLAVGLLGAAWATNFLGIQDAIKALADVGASFDALGATIHNLLPVIAGLTTAVVGLGVLWVAQNAEMIVFTATYYAYFAAINVVKAGTVAWATVQAALNFVLSANPIGLVVVAIATLVAVLVTAYNTNEDFRNSVDAAWAAIQNAATVVFPAIGQALDGFLDKLADGIIAAAQFGDAVGGVIDDVVAQWQAGIAGWGALFDSIGTMVHDAFQGIVDFIHQVWDGVPQDIRDDLELILQNLEDRGAAMLAAVQDTWTSITTAVGGAMSSVGTAVHDGWDAVTTVVGNAMSAIGSVVADGWAAITSAVGDAMSSVGSAVRDGWDQITTIIGSAMSAIGSAVSEGWSAVTTTITTALGQAVAAVTQFAGEIVAALSGVASAAGQAAQDIGNAIVQGIISGAQNLASALGAKLADIVRGGLAAAKAALDIQSPSKVFADEVGAPIVQGIVVGAEGAEPLLIDFMGKLAGDAVDAADAKGADFLGVGTSWMDKLAAGGEAEGPAVMATFGKWNAAIVAETDGQSDLFTTIGKKWGAALADGWGAETPVLIGVMSGAADDASAALGTHLDAGVSAAATKAAASFGDKFNHGMEVASTGIQSETQTMLDAVGKTWEAGISGWTGLLDKIPQTYSAGLAGMVQNTQNAVNQINSIYAGMGTPTTGAYPGGSPGTPNPPGNTTPPSATPGGTPPPPYSGGPPIFTDDAYMPLIPPVYEDIQNLLMAMGYTSSPPLAIGQGIAQIKAVYNDLYGTSTSPAAEIGMLGLDVVAAAMAQYFVSNGFVPGMADGGIAMGPTLRVFGEAGPEAVLPLDRLPQLLPNLIPQEPLMPPDFAGGHRAPTEVHYHAHMDGTTYGQLDMDRHIIQLIKDAAKSGAFRDVLLTPSASGIRELLAAS